MAPTILLDGIDIRTHPSYRLNTFMRRPDVLIAIFWWHALLRFLPNPPLLPPKRTSDQTRSLFLCRRAGVHARTRKNHWGSHIQLRCKSGAVRQADVKSHWEGVELKDLTANACVFSPESVFLFFFQCKHIGKPDRSNICRPHKIGYSSRNKTGQGILGLTANFSGKLLQAN